MYTLPPGFSTRWISFTSSQGRLTCSRTAAQWTPSNDPGLNGSATFGCTIVSAVIEGYTSTYKQLENIASRKPQPRSMKDPPACTTWSLTHFEPVWAWSNAEDLTTSRSRKARSAIRFYSTGSPDRANARVSTRRAGMARRPEQRWPAAYRRQWWIDIRWGSPPPLVAHNVGVDTNCRKK
jgi:hypothetical protein